MSPLSRTIRVIQMRPAKADLHDNGIYWLLFETRNQRLSPVIKYQ